MTKLEGQDPEEHAQEDGGHAEAERDRPVDLVVLDPHDPIMPQSTVRQMSFSERAREKQLARDEDRRRLAAGEVTREQLREEHGFGVLARTARIIWSKGKLY